MLAHLPFLVSTSRLSARQGVSQSRPAVHLSWSLELVCIQLPSRHLPTAGCRQAWETSLHAQLFWTLLHIPKRLRKVAATSCCPVWCSHGTCSMMYLPGLRSDCIASLFLFALCVVTAGRLNTLVAAGTSGSRHRLWWRWLCLPRT